LAAVSRPEDEYFTSKSKKSKKEKERGEGRGGGKNLFSFFNFAVYKILHVSTVTIVLEYAIKRALKSRHRFAPSATRCFICG
jgi:hypothetical protein